MVGPSRTPHPQERIWHIKSKCTCTFQVDIKTKEKGHSNNPGGGCCPGEHPQKFICTFAYYFVLLFALKTNSSVAQAGLELIPYVTKDDPEAFLLKMILFLFYVHHFFACICICQIP